MGRCARLVYRWAVGMTRASPRGFSARICMLLRVLGFLIFQAIFHGLGEERLSSRAHMRTARWLYSRLEAFPTWDKVQLKFQGFSKFSSSGLFLLPAYFFHGTREFLACSTHLCLIQFLKNTRRALNLPRRAWLTCKSLLGKLFSCL